jgi:hypothetical protein
MRIGLLMLGNASVQAMVGRAPLAEGGRLRGDNEAVCEGLY